MSPNDGPVRSTERTRVAVCVCTCRRNDRLVELLDRLVLVAKEASEPADLGVVIIDDDPAGGAERVVADYASAYALGITYRLIGSGNISIARNAALAGGMDMADWLAITDDDCMPEPDWVVQLLAAQRATGAMGITGFCKDIPSRPVPRWVTDGVMITYDAVDLSPLDIGMLKNTMLSADWLRSHPAVRFDTGLGRLGGEDPIFFRVAAAAGLGLHFTRQAVVIETFPAERLTFRALVRRWFWLGNSEALTNRRFDVARHRLALRGIKRLGLHLAAPFVRLVRRQPLLLLAVVPNVASDIGLVAGACGVKVKHH